MPLLYVSGDPLLTRAQVLAFGHNVRGRLETSAVHTRLADRYPAAFSTYQRRAAQGKFKTGTVWMWRDSKPMLGFLIVRETPFGATRLRFVESVVLGLARDYPLEGIRSLALIAPGQAYEWSTMKQVFEHWLGKSALPVIVYEQVIAGTRADETPLLG